MPLPVSILIPCHNAADHLAQCLTSAIAQDVQQIVFLDDGSTDNSWAIAQQFSQHIELHQQANAGIVPTRNALLNLATQPYIQYLDADDYLYEEKVKRQLEAIDGTDKIAYCNFDIERGDGTVDHHEIVHDMTCTLLRWEYMPQTNAFLFPSAAIKSISWHESYTRWNTFKLIFDLIRGGHDFLFTPFFGYLYRQEWSTNQASAAAKERMRCRDMLDSEIFAWAKQTLPISISEITEIEDMIVKRKQYEKSLIPEIEPDLA